MLTIENTDVFGWEAAIRGMRNPLNSWAKSDSEWKWLPFEGGETLDFCVGENDLSLMKKLSAAGSDHAKFLRMINVTCDITAPLYWWKEFDTYKVGTVANSCSTMHKIHAKEFVLDDFSHEHLMEDEDITQHGAEWIVPKDVLNIIVETLNAARKLYIETEDKRYWWQMIQLLPSSYNQRRTVQMNYQVLKNIYLARRNHKLDEWHNFCDWLGSLPYFAEVCLGG